MPVFHDPQGGQQPVKNENEPYGTETSDRSELIQMIKRGENPRWVPPREYEQSSVAQESEELNLANKPILQQNGNAPPLHPAIELKGPEDSTTQWRDDRNKSNFEIGKEIERPGSALHAGDFTEQSSSSKDPLVSLAEWATPQKAESTNSWNFASNETFPVDSPPQPSFPQRNAGHSQMQWAETFPAESSQPIPITPRPETMRSRAPSFQSFSSGFVLKTPTSPLVQQSNNEDLDFSPIELPEKSGESNGKRRHTFDPYASSHARSLSMSLSQAARQPPSMQRENTNPHSRAQYIRRSLNLSQTLMPSSVSPPRPSAGFLRSPRRPSLSGDSTPLHHASMVGSYEESILRGRMSAMPSKPFEFTAQIGALGKGDCKPKYPKHVTVDFPAVFYSWPNADGARSPVSDEPSPYVGQLDLEHKLPPPQIKRGRRQNSDEMQLDDEQEGVNSPSKKDTADLTKRGHRHRRSISPSQMPQGGCYRIPQRGQIQILIKNPNKTAVKLFLVPYDLSDMKPGTKTFIRQKSYSTGPIVEKPLSSSKAGLEAIALKRRSLNLDSSKGIGSGKPTLRYLIHLQICCPVKGRFYLYKAINVVFANRVPDNKEALQNEIRLPEPRYSPYKPSAETPARSSAATPVASVPSTPPSRPAFSLSSPLMPGSTGGRVFSSGIGQVEISEARGPAPFGGAIFPRSSSFSFSKHFTEQKPKSPSGAVQLQHPGRDLCQKPARYDPSFGATQGRATASIDTHSRGDPQSLASPKELPLVSPNPNEADATAPLYPPLSREPAPAPEQAANGSLVYPKLRSGNSRPGTPTMAPLPGEGLLAKRLRENSSSSAGSSAGVPAVLPTDGAVQRGVFEMEAAVLGEAVERSLGEAGGAVEVDDKMEVDSLGE